MSVLVSGQVSGAVGCAGARWVLRAKVHRCQQVEGSERTPEANYGSFTHIPLPFRFPKPPQPDSQPKSIDWMNKNGLHPALEGRGQGGSYWDSICQQKKKLHVRKPTVRDYKIIYLPFSVAFGMRGNRDKKMS